MQPYFNNIKLNNTPCLFVSEIYAEDQVLTVDESRVFSPPSKLQVPDTPISNSDSALSAPDSDGSSDDDDEEESGPVYANEGVEPETQRAVPTPTRHQQPIRLQDPNSNRTPPKREDATFRYDSGNLTPTSRAEGHFKFDGAATRASPG